MNVVNKNLSERVSYKKIFYTIYKQVISVENPKKHHLLANIRTTTIIGKVRSEKK